MKVPINWLRDYIQFDDEQALVNGLTAIGHLQDGPAKKVAGTRVYDLEIRQNRPDCLSVIGIAREAAAILNSKINNPVDSSAALPSVKDKTKITIQEPNLCYRFNSVTIGGLKIGSSPAWLVQKLAAYGIKSINNLVDITNFVMVELGQPLHAFDLKKIAGNSLIIRLAKSGEKLTVLGNKKLSLDKQDLVITDGDKVVALAGVIGAGESAVSQKTTAIILEAATYNHASVRRSSRAHEIRTEASTRLEKFLHPHLTQLALQRAVELILLLCGGKVIDHTDSYPKPAAQVSVIFSIKRLNLLAGGVLFSPSGAQSILNKLELPSARLGEDQIKVAIPYFRTDLTQEVDIIEEVLRIWGYDKIPSHLPKQPAPKNIDSQSARMAEQVGSLLVAAGYDEQITDPLTFETAPKLDPIKLENSLNADKTMLRTSLKYNLLNALKWQQKFRKEQIKLFEIGKVYYKEDNNYKEKTMLGLIADSTSYFDIKGLFALLQERFETKLKDSDLKIETVDVNDKIYFAEIEMDKFKETRIIRPSYQPAHLLLQDLSLYVPKNARVGELITDIYQASKLIQKVVLGEEPRIQHGQKTVFLNLQFSSLRTNLTKEGVEPEKAKIILLLQKKYKAQIR